MLQSKDLKRKKFSWMLDSKSSANPPNQQVDQNINANNTSNELSRTEILANDGNSTQMCNHNADDCPSSHAEPTSALISTIGESSVDNLSNMPSMDKLESSNVGNSESCDENQTCNKSNNLTVTPCNGNGVSSKSADTANCIEVDNFEKKESSTCEKGPDWTQINASWFEPSPAISLPQSTSDTLTTTQQTLTSLPVKRPVPVTTRIAAVPLNNKQFGKATNKAAQQNNSLNDDDDFDVASAWSCDTNVASNEGKTDRTHTTHEVATFQSGKRADDFNIENAGNYNIITPTHNAHPTSGRSSNNNTSVRSEVTVAQETIAVKHSPTVAKNSNKQVMGVSLQQNRPQNQGQTNKINNKMQTITASEEPVSFYKANNRESSAVSNKVIQRHQHSRPEDHVQPTRSTDQVQKDADRFKSQVQVDRSKSQEQMDRSKSQAQVDRSKSQVQVDRSKSQVQVDRSKDQVQTNQSRSQVQMDRSENQEHIDRFQDQRSAGRSKDQTRPDHQLNGANTDTNISPKSVCPPYTLHTSRSSAATKQNNFPSNVAATNKRNSDITEHNSAMHNSDMRNGDLRNGSTRNGDMRNGDMRSSDIRNGDMRSSDMRNGDVRNSGVRNVRNGTVLDTNQTKSRQFTVNDTVSFHSFKSWSDDEMPPLELDDTLSSNAPQDSRSAVAFLNSGGRSNNGYQENGERHNGGYRESGDKRNGGYPESGERGSSGYARSGDKRNGGYPESGDKRNGGYPESGERGSSGYVRSGDKRNGGYPESGDKRNGGYPESGERGSSGYARSGDKRNGGYPESGDKRNGGYPESGERGSSGYVRSGDKRNGGYPESGDKRNGGYPESGERGSSGYARSGDKCNGGYPESGDKRNGGYPESGERGSSGYVRSGDKRNGGYPESGDKRNGGYPESGDKRNGGYPESGERGSSGYARSGDKRNGGYPESGDRGNSNYAKSGERGNGGYLERERRQNVESGERRNNSSHSGWRTAGQQNRPGVNKHKPRGDVDELFVGNLDNRVTEEELLRGFEPFQATDVRIIRKEGKAPLAFVTFPSLECAQDAWAVMDGNREFYGRPLNIQASYRTMADEDAVRNEAAGVKIGRGRGRDYNGNPSQRQAAWRGEDARPAPKSVPHWSDDEDDWQPHKPATGGTRPDDRGQGQRLQRNENARPAPKSIPNWSDDEDDWQPRRLATGRTRHDDRGQGQRSQYNSNSGSNTSQRSDRNIADITARRKEMLQTANKFFNSSDNRLGTSVGYSSSPPDKVSQSQSNNGFHGNISPVNRTEPQRLSIGRGQKLLMSLDRDLTSQVSPGVPLIKTTLSPPMSTTPQQITTQSHVSTTSNQRAVVVQSELPFLSLQSSPAVKSNSKAPFLSLNYEHNVSNAAVRGSYEQDDHIPSPDALFGSDGEIDLGHLVEVMVSYEPCPMMRGRVSHDHHRIMSDLFEMLHLSASAQSSNELQYDDAADIANDDNLDLAQLGSNDAAEAGFSSLGLDCVQQTFIDNMLIACSLTNCPILRDIPPRFEAVISYVVEHGYIWVQPTLPQLTNLQNVITKMSEQVSQKQFTANVNAADIVGKPCFAPFDSKWHRAWAQCWMPSGEDLVRVFFIDFGNVAVLNVSELRPASCNPRVWNIRPLAVPCHLHHPVDEKVLLDLEEEGTSVTMIRTDPDYTEGYVIEVDLE